MNTAVLNRLLQLTEVIRKVDDEFPIHHIAILLVIAKKPGITAAELESSFDLSTTSIGRTIWKLVDKLELVRTEPDADDRRLKRLHLTAGGERFVNQLLAV